MKQFHIQFLLFISILANLPSGQISAQKIDMEKFLEEKNNFIKSKIGTAFENFSLNDQNGNLFSDKQLIGKVTLVNFWFEACAPCVAYPTTIIVDKQGIIRFVNSGGLLKKEKITELMEMYKQKILELLDE